MDLGLGLSVSGFGLRVRVIGVGLGLVAFYGGRTKYEYILLFSTTYPKPICIMARYIGHHSACNEILLTCLDAFWLGDSRSWMGSLSGGYLEAHGISNHL